MALRIGRSRPARAASFMSRVGTIVARRIASSTPPPTTTPGVSGVGGKGVKLPRR
ncbi:MAG: hypothetical protein QM704_20870 [Anaeromyxobacteraceae bacterium]